MADAPIHVEPIDQPASKPKSTEARGPLNYRTIRWMNIVGVAPRWIDLVLLAVAALGVAFALSFFILLLDADSWGERLLASGVCLVALMAVVSSSWWSNHFKHRRVDDQIDPATIRTPEAGQIETEQRSENVV